jgi:hypothetical protein
MGVRVACATLVCTLPDSTRYLSSGIRPVNAQGLTVSVAQWLIHVG